MKAPNLDSACRLFVLVSGTDDRYIYRVVRSLCVSSENRGRSSNITFRFRFRFLHSFTMTLESIVLVSLPLQYESRRCTVDSTNNTRRYHAISSIIPCMTYYMTAKLQWLLLRLVAAAVEERAARRFGSGEIVRNGRQTGVAGRCFESCVCSVCACVMN